MSNITIIGINFYPEDSATGLYTTLMAEHLATNYNVEVITGFPYYPEWKIREGYKNKPLYLMEEKDGITIYRYKQYVPPKPTFKNRIFHLLDFTFGSIPNLFKIKKTDLVICIVPFTSSIIMGLFLASLRGAKVWVHIQDFEFDAALESGIAGERKGIKKIFFKTLFWIESKLLDHADIVSTISYGMLDKLRQKTQTPTYYFPNWIDEKFINPLHKKPHKFLHSDKFKILYSGNIGAKQDWDFFLKLARYFQKKNDIEFIIVGAGAKKEWLVKQTVSFKNVTHYPPVPYNELSDLLCSADLHFLFQKNDVIDTVMPSKLLGMMASAVPSIITGNLNSEVAKIFEESEIGYFYDSNDFETVVQTIETLSTNKDLSKMIGKNARQYVIENFSSNKVLNNFEKKMYEIMYDKN